MGMVCDILFQKGCLILNGVRFLAVGQKFLRKSLLFRLN